MHYNNVLFDLGGVLIDVDARQSLTAFANMIGVPRTGRLPHSVSEMVHTEGLLNEHVSQVIDKYQIGAISTADFVQELRAQCRPETTTQQVIEAWQAMLIGIPQAKKDLLVRLRQAGKEIYVLSNINELHVQWTQQNFPELAVAKRLFFSNEIGVAKPDPRCYNMVIQQTGIVPAQTVYIDDLADNIAAGKKAGFQCLHATDDTWMEQL